MPPDPPTVAHVGPCRLVGEAGAGEFGAIHRGELRRSIGGFPQGAAVDVHVLRPPEPLPAATLGELARRVDDLSRVEDPYLVRALVAGIEPGRDADLVYVVTEPVGGRTLRQVLDRHGPLEEATVLRLMAQGARALANLHGAGFCHGALDLDHLYLTDEHTLRIQGAEAAPLRPGHGGMTTRQADIRTLGESLREALTGTDDGSLTQREITPFAQALFDELLCGESESVPTAARLIAIVTAAERSSWWLSRHGAEDAPATGGLHGRRRELEQFGHAFDQIEEGDARVILLEGETGAGKSRVIAEFLDSLRRDGRDHDVLRGAYRTDDNAPEAALLAACRARFRPTSGGKDPLVPFLGRAPELLRTFRALLEREEEAQLPQERLGAALVRIVRKLAAGNALVVVIEDFDLAASGTASLLSALVKATTGHRVLVVVTTALRFPTNWLSALADRGAVIPLELPRLSDEAVLGLVADLSGEWPPARRRAELLRRAEGLPGLAHALVTAAGPMLALDDAREIPLPFGVRQSLLDRLARLGQTTRAVLELGACMGREFDPAVLAEARDERTERLVTRLRRAAATRRVIRRVGTRYAFTHPLLHETVLSGLDESVRREHHGRLAEVLAGRLAAATPRTHRSSLPREDTLARHFLMAGATERALPYLGRGMERLEEEGRDEELHDLCRLALADRSRAIDDRTRLTWHLTLAAALLRLGRTLELRQVLAAARDSLG